MRTNGFLTYSMNGDNGKPEFNDSGLPTISLTSTKWSEDVPCFIETLSTSTSGQYSDGKFRQDSYRVLIERQSLEADRIKITRHGKYLGEFGVKGITPISLDRIEILTDNGY